ncbi:MAG: helix-turn-helix domain-containing protein [Bacteroidia bacterium]|jgi:transcriptional regulator with XRE-family HTH domain
MNEIANILFTQLGAERERKKVSVRKLCSLASVHESTYYRWVSGKTEPSVKTIQKLFTALRNETP